MRSGVGDSLAGWAGRNLEGERGVAMLPGRKVQEEQGQQTRWRRVSGSVAPAMGTRVEQRASEEVKTTVQ